MLRSFVKASALMTFLFAASSVMHAANLPIPCKGSFTYFWQKVDGRAAMVLYSQRDEVLKVDIELENLNTSMQGTKGATFRKKSASFTQFLGAPVTTVVYDTPSSSSSPYVLLRNCTITR